MARGMESYGRRWSIAPDCFVMSSCMSAFLEAFWLSALIALAVKAEYFNCQVIALIKAYVYANIAVAFASLIISLLLMSCSSRGTMADVNARKHVPKLVLARYALVLIEFCLCIVGSLVAFGGVVGCHTYRSDDDTVNDSTLVPLLQAVVISAWIVLAISILRIWWNYDAFGKNFIAEDAARSKAQWMARLSSICSMCVPKAERTVFEEVAEEMYIIFGGEDITFSDVLAGFRSVNYWQKQTHQLSDGLLENTTPLGVEDQPLFESIVYHHKYSLAICSWPLLTFMHPSTAICRLAGKCGAHCFVAPDHVQHDDCCRLAYTGFKAIAELGPEADVIYADFGSGISHPHFAVCVDHHAKSIVIAMRGTMSAMDCLTDGRSSLDSYDLPGFGPTRAHRGILIAAKNILDGLETKAHLEAVVQDTRHGGYRIITCGHSLGAGVASILAGLMRGKEAYCSTICYAYSPPGMMFEEDAAVFSERFVTTLVTGVETVPRLSYSSMLSLRASVVKALTYSKTSKIKTILGVKRHQAGEWWLEEDVVPAAEIHSPSAHPKMFVPGKVMHIIRNEKQPFFSKPHFTMHWADRRNFQRILVDGRMFTDHLPNTFPLIDDLPWDHTTVQPQPMQLEHHHHMPATSRLSIDSSADNVTLLPSAKADIAVVSMV